MLACVKLSERSAIPGGAGDTSGEIDRKNVILWWDIDTESLTHDTVRLSDHQTDSISDT